MGGTKVETRMSFKLGQLSIKDINTRYMTKLQGCQYFFSEAGKQSRLTITNYEWGLGRVGFSQKDS